MPPKKKLKSTTTSSCSSSAGAGGGGGSKKNQQSQQPICKFGIQHFFNLHTQSTLSQSLKSPPKSNSLSNPKIAESSSQIPITNSRNDAVENADDLTEVSPEITKSVSVQGRYNFSPGMLIKQSQDDGGDEVTWRISPVNERLQAFSKQIPTAIQVLRNDSSLDSKLNSFNIRSCSLNQASPGSAAAGKVGKSLVSANGVGLKRVNQCPEVNLTDVNSSLASQQSPFLTPPSLSYFHERVSDVTEYNASLDQLGLRQHKKALIELLDQVEDAIASEDSSSSAIKSSNIQDGNGYKTPLEAKPLVKEAATNPPENVDAPLSNHNFLVLEVSEKHKRTGSSGPQCPYKVLHLLNEQSGEEKAVYLWDEWFYTVIAPGDTVNVIGEFDNQGKCDVDRDNNLVIVHPDILVSGTRVAASFSCPRRTVLDERLKCAEHSTAALIGTLLHQIFQAGLMQDNPAINFLEDYAKTVLQKNIETVYACGVNETDMLKTLVEAIPKLINWIILFKYSQVMKSPRNFLFTNINFLFDLHVIGTSCSCQTMMKSPVPHNLLCLCPRYTNVCRQSALKDDDSLVLWQNSKTPVVDFGSDHGLKKIKISEVIDIEEMAWAPKYGLKGMIDASVSLRVESSGNGEDQKIVPLEFKTGKVPNGQSSMEHVAQVILYTLLMSERYLEHIDSGLLYYLQSDQTQGIIVRRPDVVGLIMRRNELANDILKASSTQKLPQMLRSPSMCRSCRHLDVCTIYHKVHGGSKDSSGLGDEFDSWVHHLTTGHCGFLRHWDWLIDLEAKETQLVKSQLWRSHSSKSDRSTSCLSSIVLDTLDGAPYQKSLKENRFIYRFVHLNSPSLNVHASDGDYLTVLSSSAEELDYTLKSGDYVILSTKFGHQTVASGFVTDISHSHVSVSFSKRLRLPGSCSEINDLSQEVWRIDKDEFMTSFSVMRFNLVQLFLRTEQSSHLRKMIVDLEVPQFDSGCVFSQDPAISYIWLVKSLNGDQRRAILKILTAKDYALILGMPGTGKTSTLVHAVKAMLMRGASILLTSYTNSAVDNLLIKLKAQGIDFLRIGRLEAVHEEVRANCFSAMDVRNVEDIRLRIEQVKVVAVTCLGITSPLLVNRKFDVCIMDEAGQITLPISLGPLMYATKFVLVGDHYQLPPLVQSTEARENGMGISLFCRLSEAHPQAISALQSQYRMCQDIMELSNALIYGDRLRCGSSEIANARLKFSSLRPCSSWLKEVLNPSRSVIFINTDMLPAFEAKDSKTVNNPIEAYIVAEVTKELINHGVLGEDIGIITPYNSQANLIRTAVCIASVEIHTIDKYQGRDKECILVSFVRSSENPRICTSSLLGDWHRMNVALTRAKKKLILVGSCKTLSKVPLLKLLVGKIEKQSGILNVSKKDINYNELKGELKRSHIK